MKHPDRSRYYQILLHMHPEDIISLNTPSAKKVMQAEGFGCDFLHHMYTDNPKIRAALRRVVKELLQ